MKVDLSKYSMLCGCGKTHDMKTCMVAIESGAMKKLGEYMSLYGYTGRCCAVYDETTYRITEGMHPECAQEIVLDPEGLHADEKSTAYVLSILESDIEIMIAVGAGTIHDITRYCAHERGLDFISCPTGASVDGFCSTVCSMTWYGYKKTMPAVAPVMVVADTDIFSHAPVELVRSGVGDILAKFTALADWRIAHIVTGEYLCETIYGIVDEALHSVANGIDDIVTGSPKAYEDVMYALVMSGVAMQMIGNSRPASGCEHHISHMIEMKTPALEVEYVAMHGEKTGVGAVIGARVYHEMAKTADIAPLLVPFEPVSHEYIREIFGDGLKDAIIEENEKDVLATVDNKVFAEKWPEVVKVIEGIPSADEIYQMLAKLGAKKDLSDIGIGEDKMDIIIKASPIVRNRLTLMRMRRLFRDW
ncbi:MAG: sn-glycerol-1-phosphate dehydrogenase [Eubacteriaceae bacterium]|nr:sn-glycerol-1-phosphate dehydrogenase [Eubacteriaceae bacterium]